MSEYGTIRKTGIEYIHADGGESYRDDNSDKSWIERGRPDRQFSPLDMKYFCWIDQKAGEFDKNDPTHYIIPPARQFVIFARYYNSPDIPLVFAEYSKTTKEWFVFSMNRAIECIDHIKMTPKGYELNDITFLYRHLPILRYKKYPVRPTKPRRINASWDSMIALDFKKLKMNLIKNVDWVKKLPVI